MHAIGVVLAALAGVGIAVWLERWLPKPGVAFLLFAVVLLAAGVQGLVGGMRLVPIGLLLQVPVFLYLAYLRRTQARATRSSGCSSRRISG